MKDSIEELIAKIPTSDQERASYLYNDMKAFFSLEEPFTFLDMGTGSGSMAAVILNQFGGSRGELVDVISRLRIREFLPDIDESRFVQHSYPVREKLLGKEFDLVLSMDVLEHIWNWKTSLRDLFQYVRPGGYLYIQTPSNYPSPNYPVAGIYANFLKGLFGKNKPDAHVRHGLSCKALLDVCSKEFMPIVAAEDYVVNGKMFCSFKPRTHVLLKKRVLYV